MAVSEKRGSTGLALKAGFWYVVSNFLVKGLAFITTPIFARLMTEADYGEFSNYASWQSTLLIITGAELYNTLSRAYYDYNDDYDTYVSSVTILNLIITVVFYIVFLLGRKWIFNIVAIPEQFIHILFASLLFQAWKEIYMAKERVFYSYKKVALLSVVNLIIPTLVSVFLVIYLPETYRLSGRIYGFYVPASLIGMFCAISILRKKRTIKKEQCVYAIRLALPLLVHYLTAYLLTSSNTIVTKSVLGAETAALVSITTSVIHILTILLQALSGAMTTWLMDNLEQNNDSVVRKGLLYYVGGMTIVAIGVMLLAPEIVWILGGPKYEQANVLMPGMVVAVIIQAITTVFTIILTYRKSVVKTAMYTAIIAIVSIVVKVVVLPQFGVEILPFINIIAFAFLFVVDYVLVRNEGYGKVINLKGFSACIVSLVFVMLCCYFLYQHILIRYAVIGVVGCTFLFILYRYRKYVAQFINRKIRKKN